MAGKGKMKRWFWLSFADSERPAGQHFIGVALVLAKDPVAAMKTAWTLGINPGGQIAAWPLDDAPEERWTNRLLTREDVIAMQGEARTLGDLLAERERKQRCGDKYRSG